MLSIATTAPSPFIRTRTACGVHSTTRNRLLCPRRQSVYAHSNHHGIHKVPVWFQQTHLDSSTCTRRSGSTIRSSRPSTYNDGEDGRANSSTTPLAVETTKGDDSDSLSSPSDADDLVGSIAKQMKTIPNIITMSRIASTPFISYLILAEQYEYAVSGCIAFGLTDWLDGYIAKNYSGQSTVLGTYLDPLADKIMINTLATSLWYNSLLPGPVVGIWLARDIGLIVTSYAAVSRATKRGHATINPATTPLKIKPTLISKVNTAFQFLTISGGMAQPLLGLSPDIVMGLWYVLLCSIFLFLI